MLAREADLLTAIRADDFRLERIVRRFYSQGGFALMAVVLSFNLLGDGPRDALDPKLRR